MNHCFSLHLPSRLELYIYIYIPHLRIYYLGVEFVSVYIAYSGDYCQEDHNGCSEIQCFEGVECFDKPAPDVGALCGPCPPGFTGDGEKCTG